MRGSETWETPVFLYKFAAFLICSKRGKSCDGCMLSVDWCYGREHMLPSATDANREPKEAELLSHGRKPELNISQARTVVSS